MSAQRRQRFAGAQSRSLPTSSSNSLYTIYVLECKHGKYYVGRTRKPVETRFMQHLADPKGWTSLYEPLRIAETFHRQESDFEDYITKKYMRKHGIDNVRGGSYARVELSENAINAIQREQLSTEDRCFNCQSTGHFANRCPAPPGTSTRQTRAPVPNTRRSYSARESPSSSSSSSSGNERRLACFRCGYTSHFADRCYAEYHVNGKYLGTRNYNEDSD